jgi:hypothetical protein
MSNEIGHRGTGNAADAAAVRRGAAVTTSPVRAAPRRASSVIAVEHLEPRQFMSASLKVDNLDVLPGFERMIFNRIRNPNLEKPNFVKERGTLRLSNTGDETLRFGEFRIDGPFRGARDAAAVDPGRASRSR